MHSFLLFCLWAVASAEALVIYPGPCPHVKPMENFDLSRWQGKWYELARYPNVAEAGTKGKCTTGEYIIFGDVGKAKSTHVVDGVKSYAKAGLTRVGLSKVRLTYTFGDRFKDHVLNILKTDYLNYAIGYGCTYFPENNTHQVTSWIFARAPIMDESSKTIVNNYIQVSQLLEADKFIANDHSPAACSSSITYEITDFLD